MRYVWVGLEFMIRILLLEHLGGTELAAEALKVHIARFLPARRPLRAPVPERRFTPPAKRKSDLAPSLKKSSPSLLSRFAGASQRAMPAHGGNWAVVATLQEALYPVQCRVCSRLIWCLPEFWEASLKVQRLTGWLEICRGSVGGRP